MTKKDTTTATDPGPRPELKWIKLTQLFVPTEYQRSTKSDASIKNINHIRERFNWGDCGALVVCPLAGATPPQYAVIDGQHRLRAAEAHGGITELPCVVIRERDTRDQARNFVAINRNRVKLNTLQEYHAAVVAGDPDAVALDEILKKCGVTVAQYAFDANEMHPRCTMAAGTLLKMIQNYSEKQIVWVLTLIPEAYGDERGMLRADLILLLAEYLKAHADVDRARMIETLRSLDVEELRKDARAYRQIQGGTARAAMTAVLERHYKSAGRKSAA